MRNYHYSNGHIALQFICVNKHFIIKINHTKTLSHTTRIVAKWLCHTFVNHNNDWTTIRMIKVSPTIANYNAKHDDRKITIMALNTTPTMLNQKRQH